MSEEKVPVSEALKPLDAKTIYKTERWWCSVVLLEAFGRRQVALYLWRRSGDKWKRQQKFIVHDRGEWEKVKEAVEGFLRKIEAI